MSGSYIGHSVGGEHYYYISLQTVYCVINSLLHFDVLHQLNSCYMKIYSSNKVWYISISCLSHLCISNFFCFNPWQITEHARFEWTKLGFGSHVFRPSIFLECKIDREWNCVEWTRVRWMGSRNIYTIVWFTVIFLFIYSFHSFSCNPIYFEHPSQQADTTDVL